MEPLDQDQDWRLGKREGGAGWGEREGDVGGCRGGRCGWAVRKGGVG